MTGIKRPNPPYRNRKERQKNYRKARKTGVDNDSILMYDVATQSLESRPIAKVYGVVNMYRDGLNPENMDHLEQGLARLENDAAQTIQRIHSAIESGQRNISMKRKELEAIRKFVYLMHYRRTSLVGSYFDENDPDNRPLKDYMQKFRQTHNLHNKDDFWLFGLKYILDTPHHKIVGTGEAIQERYGGPKAMLSMMMTRVDPDIGNFHAVDYTSMANAYFLGIWEAPEGEEFVVGSNSFGLWEGILDGLSGMHRIFVVSPRIALILRNNILAEHMIEHVKTQALITSELVDVSMRHAISTHVAFNPPLGDEDQEAVARALWKYRQTPAAQEDNFMFMPTRLTHKETYAVNNVILVNLRSDNNVTFASPVAMAKTLQYHLQHKRPDVQKSKYWYRSLFGTLNTNPCTPSQLPRSGIDITLDAIANGTIEFRSTYDRAYRVYHLATDNVAAYNQTTSEIHRMTGQAIFKMTEILPTLPPGFRNMYFPIFCRGLVKELPKEESELFFALVGHRVDVFKIGPHGNDILSRIKYEAAIIGFTHWLAENRPWVLFDLLSFWVKVVL